LKYWNINLQNANVELSASETTESTVANDNGEQVPGGNVITPQEQSQTTASQLEFPFRIEAIVCLSDSVLALHRHGVQGRSLVDGSVTQDLHDTAHIYRMLGSDKYVCGFDYNLCAFCVFIVHFIKNRIFIAEP
jgi:hypothetical protein